MTLKEFREYTKDMSDDTDMVIQKTFSGKQIIFAQVLELRKGCYATGDFHERIILINDKEVVK